MLAPVFPYFSAFLSLSLFFPAVGRQVDGQREILETLGLADRYNIVRKTNRGVRRSGQEVNRKGIERRGRQQDGTGSVVKLKGKGPNQIFSPIIELRKHEGISCK